MARRRRRTRRRRWLRRGLLWLALLALLATVLPTACCRVVDPPLSALMLERILEARAAARPHRIEQQWIGVEEVAPALRLAVVAAEDQRFARHRGFDVKEMSRALEGAAEGERLRGASTISQQLAKNLFLWSGRSVVRKGLEVWFTVWLELLLPKRRILELYLNVVELGDGLYGVEAASRRYFGRGAAALDAQQAALLAAVLPSPRRLRLDPPSRAVRARAARIRTQMTRLGTTGIPGL